jgi:biopolymer transport protein TolR
MGMGPTNSKGIKSEINVTPLVDVVLVLLIIFMVVAPMLQRAKAVELPHASHIDKNKVEEEPFIISITADKKIWLGARMIGESLEANIKAALKENPEKQFLIKGDRRLNVRDVRRVMDRIRKAGAKGVGLGVEEISR